MPTVRESVTVGSAGERIFELLADPRRATTFIPGLSRISNVSPGEWGVGNTWEFEFDWFGLVISGRSECTRFERPRLYQFRTVSGSLSTWTYEIEPDGNGCRLTLQVDYDLPQSMLARFAGPVLEQMNQKRASEIVENLKALAESSGEADRPALA